MSEIKIPFETRLQCAARFHKFKSEHVKLTWLELFNEFESDKKYGLPEGLVLLDPKFYDEIGLANIKGERLFPPAESGAKCRSMEIWGYECPYLDSKIHIDHIFPQSRGGFTHHMNAMHLCAEHNMSKHTDIHFIPWEKIVEQNEWVLLAFERLLSSAQRHAVKRLYMPSDALCRL